MQTNNTTEKIVRQRPSRNAQDKQQQKGKQWKRQDTKRSPLVSF